MGVNGGFAIPFPQLKVNPVMHAVRQLFWNQEEGRLRALWRLVIFFVALLVAGLPAAAVAQSAGTIKAFPVLAALVVLAVWLVGRYVDRRRFADFGFRFDKKWWLDLGFGMALGAALMIAIFGVEQSRGWVEVTAHLAAPDGMSFAGGMVLAVVLYVCVAINEEIQFRGYVMRNVAEGLNGRKLSPTWAWLIATVLSAAYFGYTHSSNAGMTTGGLVNIGVAGAFLAVAYLVTGSLAVPIGFHLTWNFFQGSVFGFSVSGNDREVSSILGITQSGPDAWTGGATGPEGGLIGAAAIGLALVLTLGWARLRHGSISIRTPMFQRRAAQLPDEGAAEQTAEMKALTR